jgi:signal transduction histidine kinase
MKKQLLALAALLTMALPFSLKAAEKSTQAEAQALLDKAIKLVATSGQEKAFAAFNDPKGGFQQRDLYVICYDATKVVAHNDKQYIGTTVESLQDVDGMFFGLEMLKVARKGGGSVEYKWTNPASKKVEPKITFIKPVGEGFCAVGIYK